MPVTGIGEAAAATDSVAALVAALTAASALALQKANNLSDLNSAASARTNLGVDPAGSAAALAIVFGA